MWLTQQNKNTPGNSLSVIYFSFRGICIWKGQIDQYVGAGIDLITGN